MVSDGKTSDQLIMQRRLAEALDLLRYQSQQKHRVYGLDATLDRIQKLVQNAGDASSEAQVLAAAGRIRQAANLLRTVQARIIDHPQVNALLVEFETQLEEARFLREKTAVLINKKNWQAALLTAEQAFEKNAESKTAKQQCDLIRQTLREEASEKRLRKYLTIGFVCALVLTTLVIGGVLTNNYYTNREHDRYQDGLTQATSLYQKALDLIETEQYKNASQHLKDASQILTDRDMTGDPLFAIIVQVQSSQSVTQGLAGRVRFEEQWISVEERKNIRAERERLSNDLKLLVESIQKATSGGFPGLSVASVTSERTSLLRNMLANVHKAQSDFEIGKYNEARIVYEQTLSDLNAHLEKSGLVCFKGQWIRQEKYQEILKQREALAAQAERERLAVEKEAEHQRLLAVQKKERERQDKIKQAKIEQEKKENEERKKKMSRLGRTAYLQSQKFVKDILKSPTSAIFPPYSDDAVIIGEAPTKGHYLISSYVDAKNVFGTMLRKRYDIELWPIDDEGNQWKTNGAVLDK